MSLKTDMEEQEKSVEFLSYVVENLVDYPEDVSVVRTVDEMGVLLTLSVNPEDMGKVIGRKGATAKAIRTLLRVVGMKYNARVNMKISEPEGYERPAPVSDEAPTEAPVEEAPVEAEAPTEEAPVAADVDSALEELKSDL